MKLKKFTAKFLHHNTLVQLKQRKGNKHLEISNAKLYAGQFKDSQWKNNEVVRVDSGQHTQEDNRDYLTIIIGPKKTKITEE